MAPGDRLTRFAALVMLEHSITAMNSSSCRTSIVIEHN
jgi:hypothetical protein